MLICIWGSCKYKVVVLYLIIKLILDMFRTQINIKKPIHFSLRKKKLQ